MKPISKTAKPRTGIAALRARVAGARAREVGRAADDRAHRLLDAYLATTEAHGLPAREVVEAVARGEAARHVADALLARAADDPPEILREAACSAGCAFCCILSGGSGGTITEAEAIILHAALAPLAGQPDGRGWHPEACPALDPVTRSCRAYDARPMICRSYLSRDAAACEANVDSGALPGPGLIGSHLDYLATLSLARAALKGLARVPTYSLSRIAAGAIDGEATKDSLDAARHPAKALDEACRAMARAAGKARRV